MEEIQDSMREIAASLLREKAVKFILGQEKGSLPLKSRPIFIDKEDDVKKLTWNEFTDLNLVSFIPKTGDKIGIILKSCDIKSLIVLLNENQLKRENIIIIGMPCMGLLDKKKIELELNGKEITKYEMRDSEISVFGRDFEKTFQKSSILLENCKYCDTRIPVLYDNLITFPKTYSIPEKIVQDEYRDLKEFEMKSPEERWSYFREKLESCIRCYACRNACPLCYCKECFVDQNNPQWFGKTANLPDNILFHLIRAIHLAGRCVGCGACTRACPMNINLYLLNKKIRNVVEERFNFRAGLDVEKVCPLAVYNMEDPQEFIITEEGE